MELKTGNEEDIFSSTARGCGMSVGWVSATSDSNLRTFRSLVSTSARSQAATDPVSDAEIPTERTQTAHLRLRSTAYPYTRCRCMPPLRCQGSELDQGGTCASHRAPLGTSRQQIGGGKGL